MALGIPPAWQQARLSGRLRAPVLPWTASPWLPGGLETPLGYFMQGEAVPLANFLAAGPGERRWATFLLFKAP